MADTATPAANPLESSMTIASPVDFREPPPQSDETATPETDNSEVVDEATQPEGQPPAETTEETPEGEGAATPEVPQVLSYDRLLPLEQFQHKEEVPEELLQAAARKWKIPLDAIEQQDWVKPFLRDKINTDIAIKSQRYLEALADEEGAPAETPAQETQPEPPQPASLEQTLQQLEPIAQKLVTPEGAKAFAQGIGAAWNEYREAVESEDPKAIATAEHKIASQHMQWMMLAAQNAIHSMLPQFLPEYIRNVAETHTKTEQSWNKAMTMLSADPKFGDVIDLAKSGKLDEVFEDYPELMNRQFKDAAGKPLPPLPNLMERLRRATRIIRGENYKPATEVAEQGIRTGQQLQEKREKQKALGKLGSGRPTGNLNRSGESGGFVDSLAVAWKKEHPMEGV